MNRAIILTLVALTLASGAAPAWAERGVRKLSSTALTAGELGNLGDFTLVGAVSVHLDHLNTQIEGLIRSDLASTVDGRWLRWRPVYRGSQLVDLRDFKTATPATALKRGWQVPAVRSRNIQLPSKFPGRSDCFLASATTVSSRVLGAWHCEAGTRTILGEALGDLANPDIRQVADLSLKLDRLSAEPVMHNGSHHILLVSYNQPDRRFLYVNLFWPLPAQ